MQTIQLAPHLPAFSRLVYGAWRLNDGADQSPQTALRKIELCLAQGITTIDHADIYGNYSCEALFGEALKLAPRLKQQLQIVTKCDIMLLSPHFPKRRVKYYDTSAQHITQSVDNSLKRLGVDVIDLLLIHRPDPFMNAAETGACLDALVASGKVRGIGVSNFSPWDWQLLQSTMRQTLVTNQIEVSLLTRDAFTDGRLAQAQQLKAPPMAWSPLAAGAVLGQGEAATRLRPALQRIGSEFGVGPDAVAVAWLLAHPARIMPILGTNDLGRMAKLTDCLKVTMDRETWYELWTLAAGQEVP
jgi:predicted oxidoreductase